MARSEFGQRSNSSDGGFSLSGSLCSSHHQVSTLISSNATLTKMLSNDYCSTNSNSVEPKQLPSQQTTPAAKQSNGLRVRFSCTSECDQLLASKVSREQKSAKSKEDVRVKNKEVWYLPQLHPSPNKRNTSYSEDGKAFSRSGEDRIRARTTHQRGSDHSQAHQVCCRPRPILKKISPAECEEKVEELFSKQESCMPPRQNNWLRTIRLLEQNLERQELVAQLEEMQKQIQEIPGEEGKLRKELVKPQSSPQQGLQLSQKKRQKQNCRSVSAHDVKTMKTSFIHIPYSESKENIACRNLRKRERKSVSKLTVYPANILVYDSENGALSAKLHLKTNNHEKVSRKYYHRSLSQGSQL